jgi:hypothetical protein
MRWRAWKRRRPASAALQEAMIGFVVGFLVLTFICGGFMTSRPPRYIGAYVASGVAVGLCFTMLQSSIRRVPRWRPHERAAILACGIPSILASTFWVLMVISLIIQHW